MMVGKKVELNIERPVIENKELLLEVRNLNCINPEGIKVLKDINFDVYGGEILGIAGISGSGQKELLESIAGLQKNEKGSSIIYYQPHARDESIDGDQLVGKTPREIRDLGIRLSFVPEDRLGMGLVGSMGMTENMMLKDYRSNGHIFANVKKPRMLAEKIKDELEVVTPSISTPVKNLSGGNVQKVLVGREIAASPTVLMTAYAVRGLDINTSYTIYHLLNEQKKKGSAVIFVGEDLDVMVALCDRILVLCDGRVNGILNYTPGGENKDFNKGNIGLMMTKIDYKDETEGGKADE